MTRDSRMSCGVMGLFGRTGSITRILRRLFLRMRGFGSFRIGLDRMVMLMMGRFCGRNDHQGRCRCERQQKLTAAQGSGQRSDKRSHERIPAKGGEFRQATK